MSPRIFLAVVAAVLSVFGLVRNAGAENELDFTLVNHSGHTVRSFSVWPANGGDDSGQRNILHKPLRDGESVDVNFSEEGDRPDKWDFRVVFGDGQTVVWTRYHLKEIGKITLTWNEDPRLVNATTE